MRIVHIAHGYGLRNAGGAVIASTRLHQALVSAGVDSHYICVQQLDEGVNVHQLPLGGLRRRMFFFISKLVRYIWYLLAGHRAGYAALMPLWGLEGLLEELRPDIIQIHWLKNDVMSLDQLKRFRKPILFHLHDIWMLNGYESYPKEDLRYKNGFTTRETPYFERWLFNRKWKAVQGLDAHFVGPSQWICDLCADSVIGHGHEVSCVPYVFDSRFAYREELRRKHEKFIILFGCFGGRGNRSKGWEDLVEAIGLLPDEVRAQTELHVFGEQFEDYEVKGGRVHALGEISDPDKLVLVYHTADVFVLASRQDNSPSTKFEALHCGLPVLAFRRTGCAEAIVHRENGWVAEDGRNETLAEGLVFFFTAWREGRIPHAQIAADIKSKFATETTVRRMCSLYEQIISQSKRLEGGN